MSHQVMEALRSAIEEGIPDSRVEITAGAGLGHYGVRVVSATFAGKPMVQAHRMVYSVIAHLMKGDKAPVHAIDTLQTLAP